MAVIIISADSYDTGAAIAKETAHALQYACVDRGFLAEVAETNQTTEANLIQALEGKAPFLRKAERARKKHLAFIQQAVLARLVENDSVCYGLAAHLYVLGVSHVIRVRILADPEGHINRLISETNVTLKRAQKLLQKEHQFRRQWSLDAFGQDETDPTMYDLIISLSQIDSEEAVHLITETAKYRKFRPSTYSIKRMHDLALERRVYLELIDDFPDVRVNSRDGTVVVETLGLEREKKNKIAVIKERVGTIPGVSYIEVHVIRDLIRQAAESFR